MVLDLCETFAQFFVLDLRNAFCVAGARRSQLMDSGFAKAWRNLQFLDLPGVSFVAGARCSSPYGFRFDRNPEFGFDEN